LKKILTAILAIMMMLTLIACNSETPHNATDTTPPSPDNTATSADTTLSENTSNVTTSGDETTGAPDNSWITKDVQQPKPSTPLHIPQPVRFKESNVSAIVNLYKAPCSELNPEVLMEELKLMPMFDGWIWNIEYTETGYIEYYGDVGLCRSYERTARINAESSADYICDSITVSLNTETSTYDGWRGVHVHYSTPDRDMDASSQQFIQPLLQKLFNADAEYMLYAPATDEYYGQMDLTISNDIGYDKISRNLDDRYVSFSKYAFSKLYNQVTMYEGEDSPLLYDNAPEYLETYFPSFGTWNFNEYTKINSAFFSKWFPGYKSTYPEIDGPAYQYSITTYDNGDKDVEFRTKQKVYQNDDTFIDAALFELHYVVEVRAGTPNLKRASLTVPAFAEHWNNNDSKDPAVIKRMNENLKYATKVANGVLGTNFNFEHIHWNGPNDKSMYSNNNKVIIDGVEKTVHFEFKTSTIDALAKNRSSFTMTIV
jgi:hypothetical protein